MTDEELIEFGYKLIAKDRTSIEIFNALRIKAENEEQLSRVHKQVVKPEAVKKKRSPELVRTLLAANKLKLKFEYSVRSLVRLASAVLVVGGVTLLLASEEMNGNIPFAWTTIIQGALLMVLYVSVKYQKTYDFLLIALVGYVAIYGIELIIFGLPSDLYAAVYQDGVRIRGSRVGSGLSLLFGYLFPFIYTSLKIVFGALVFTSFWNHKKFNELPNDIKLELQDF
ncbi:MAG: hypothetical protein AB8B56_08175 [Crocinitomicaceae bacterium]